MSTYEEFCELYARARARANERRQRCAAVLAQAGDRIVRRLGIPEGAHAWRPAESEPDESGAPGTLADAMSADDDGVWRVGMQILLRDPGDPEHPFPILFSLGVKEDAEHFVVSMADGEVGHRVLPDAPGGLDALAAEADRRLREWLAENLDRALGAAGPRGQFGLYL